MCSSAQSKSVIGTTCFIDNDKRVPTTESDNCQHPRPEPNGSSVSSVSTWLAARRSSRSRERKWNYGMVYVHVVVHSDAHRSVTEIEFFIFNGADHACHGRKNGGTNAR